MPTSCKPVLLLEPGLGGATTAAAVIGRQRSRAVYPSTLPQPGGAQEKPVLTSKFMGLGTGFAVPLMCRDELVERGIAMNNVYDWQALNGRTAPDRGPIVFMPTKSRQASNGHRAVEVPNESFGIGDRQLGEQGYLAADNLNQWFDAYKRPIAIPMDISRMAVATMRPPPLKSLRKDRIVQHLTTSLSRRRFDDTLLRVNSMPDVLLGDEVRQALRKSQNSEQALATARGTELMSKVTVSAKGAPATPGASMATIRM